MRTIRRLYLYLVAVISLQTVLWGVINLLRSMLDTQRVGGGANQLAGALATIIVGLPVFFLHWWLIQRRIHVEAEERGSGVRAVFLYGLLFALLIPVAQNLLAILNRAFIDLFNVQSSAGLLGIQQTWIDNGIALVMNALLAGYFMSIVRGDWRAGMQPEDDEEAPALSNLTLAQRIFRYALVIYSLGLLIFGAQQILYYILSQLGPPNINALSPLANGLSLVIFGALLWWNSWQTVQQSLQKKNEQQSFFRLVFLYLLSVIGLVTLLFSVGTVIYEALLGIFGSGQTFRGWLLDVSEPLSSAVPFALLWVYHLMVLKADQAVVAMTPRREGLYRLYHYLLSFIGLVVSFVSLETIISYIIDELTGTSTIISSSALSSLAGGISGLIVGLPVWIRVWLQMSSRAQKEGAAGDRERRSTVRKAYLYLVIFSGVVGVMLSAGGLIFELLTIALGGQSTATLGDILQFVQVLFLFIALLVYHWRVLREDNRLDDLTQNEKHSLFPVLVLDSGDESFAAPIVSALRDEAPGIPVVVHFTTAGLPDEDLSSAGAVVLKAGMASNPPEALRIWLNSFEGQRISVPIPKEGWVWLDADTTSTSKLSRQVAKIIRKLAEGEEIEGGRLSPWVIVAAIIGGLIGLSILVNLMSFILSF